MSDDPEAKPSNEHDVITAVHPTDTPPTETETSSTRRTALGMTAAATAAILADRAIFAPDSARAEEVVKSVNGKTGKVVDIAEVNTKGPEEGKLLESQIPSSVVGGNQGNFIPLKQFDPKWEAGHDSTKGLKEAITASIAAGSCRSSSPVEKATVEPDQTSTLREALLRE